MRARRRRLLVATAVLLALVAGGSLLVQQIPQYASRPLFLLVVVIEVVIAPIPGGAIGYMGAARFGFWPTWPLLYAGNVIGTTIVFFLARRLGTPLFEENVSPKARRRYDEILRGHPLILWAAYTIPALPVDVLSVLAGLSHIRARRFFTIAFSGYVIYTGIVAWVGSSLARYIGVAHAMSAIGVVFAVGLAWGLWNHHKRRRRDGAGRRP